MVNDENTGWDKSRKSTFSLTRYQNLSRNMILIGNISGQYTNDDNYQLLSSSNLVALITAHTLPLNFQGGKGYSASLEFQYNITDSHNVLPSLDLQSYTVIQHGGAFPFRADGDSIRREDFANTVAIGLRGNYKKCFSLTCLWENPWIPFTKAEKEIISRIYHTG